MFLAIPTSVRIDHTIIIDQTAIPINLSDANIVSISFTTSVMTQITTPDLIGGGMSIRCVKAEIFLMYSYFIDVQGACNGFIINLNSNKLHSTFLNFRKSHPKTGHMAFLFHSNSINHNINTSDIIAESNPGFQPSNYADMRFVASNNLTGIVSIRFTLDDYCLRDFAFASCNNSLGLISSTSDLVIKRLTLYRCGKKLRCINSEYPEADFNLLLKEAIFIGDCPNIEIKVSTPDSNYYEDGNPIQFTSFEKPTQMNCKMITSPLILAITYSVILITIGNESIYISKNKILAI